MFPEPEPPPETTRDHVNALFVQFSPEVRGFILALLPDMGRADDVFQETFLTASKKAADFKPGTNFLAWVCTLARYKVMESGRNRQRSPQPLSDEVLEALCAVTPEPEKEDRELLALNDCLETLPQHTKRAMELRYEQGHKPAENRAPTGLDGGVRLCLPFPHSRGTARLRAAKTSASGSDRNMNEDRLDYLLDRYFDEALQPAEQTELEALLLSRPQSRTLFWKRARFHALLRRRGRESWGSRLAVEQAAGGRTWSRWQALREIWNAWQRQIAWAGAAGLAEIP